VFTEDHDLIVTLEPCLAPPRSSLNPRHFGAAHQYDMDGMSAKPQSDKEKERRRLRRRRLRQDPEFKRKRNERARRRMERKRGTSQ
jgi:hypothetical protein